MDKYMLGVGTHEPLLINTIGHCVGAVAFGVLLWLILSYRRRPYEQNWLPAIAAGLAFTWNLGSLVAILLSTSDQFAVYLTIAASFSVLSMLPAVLLHIVLGGKHRSLWITGYLLAGIATSLHILELLWRKPGVHYAAVMLITVGFGGLTLLSLISARGSVEQRGATRRLVTSMCLFLFAISFVHFGSGHVREAWSSEIALHHAGIPLALFVVLQDYRFLLIDAFLRVVLNGALALSTVYSLLWLERWLGWSPRNSSPLMGAISIVLACLILTLFARTRTALQRILTRVVFSRSDVDATVAAIRAGARRSAGEDQFLQLACAEIASFIGAVRNDLKNDPKPDWQESFFPFLLPYDLTRAAEYTWAQVVVPLHFATTDVRVLLLGVRKGGRRYLSEDLEILSMLAAVVAQEAAQLRGAEMRTLVSQAELRALQSQINPHFLFNALNTLYGVIDRDNADARRLVLNLSEVFRYFLQQERTFIRLEDELKIVRAYLAIEEARLGPKLRIELQVDDAALETQVPALSVQPLVENAVKHGISRRIEGGDLRIGISAVAGQGISIQVSNSGPFVSPSPNGTGVGLTNVRRRLQLCYGVDRDLEIRSDSLTTTVRFTVPFQLAAHQV
jgi:hypothetical protein